MPSATAIPRVSSSPAADFVVKRLPNDRDLTRRELRRAAASLARKQDIWRDHVRHDPDERQYVQLYRDPHVDIWLICWTNQQDTGYHDHDLSSGAVSVVEGELVEDRFEFSGDGLRAASKTHEAGSLFDFDASHVHRLRHARGSFATSLHVYSPALWRMGYYDEDPAGLLRRTLISYADELV